VRLRRVRPRANARAAAVWLLMLEEWHESRQITFGYSYCGIRYLTSWDDKYGQGLF
jgi:hypothetical protein